MFYRETGQFKQSYAADQAVFPILQDRLGLAAILIVAFVVVPLFGNEFLLASVMVPFLILSLGAIGLNILVGYTGLLSLGSAAFMGVGAYAAYKLSTIFPGVNILVWILCSGFFAAGIGVLFGLPSLRIKGFYLAVATLAAQFFLQWCFRAHQLAVTTTIRLGSHRSAGTDAVRHRHHRPLGHAGDALFRGARHRRGHDPGRLEHRPWPLGRTWMAVRDMDIAA
jgi:branched-chain amino acid transport system permease protein